MSKPHQHDGLPPYAEYIPAGRSVMDAMTYRVMRRIGRMHRHELWAAVTKAWAEAVTTGTGYIRLKWKP